MDDEDLLRSLADAARVESATLDVEPTLERLALGQATEDERRVLEERAAYDLEAAQHLEIYRPLGADVADRIVAAIELWLGGRRSPNRRSYGRFR